MGLILSLVVGIIAGFIASKLTDGSGKGILVDLFLGLLGGLFGGWLFSLLGISTTGGLIGEIITAVIGAALLLLIWKKLLK